MAGKLKRTLLVFALLLVLALLFHFAFPFGLIPRPAGSNCGPEHWRWLGESFESKGDVVAYLHEHELELLSGSNTPRLGGYPDDWNVSRMDVTIDWQTTTEDICVEHRLGYSVYTLRYRHPACAESQLYTFKVTSYGLASLNGCCGI